MAEAIARLPPDPEGGPPKLPEDLLKRLKTPEGPKGPKPKQVFSITRMVPPGSQNYYFTVNEEK